MAIDSDELAPLANLLDHFAAAEGSVASDAMDVEEVSAVMAEPAASESGVSEAPARPATRGAVAKGKGKAPAPAPRPIKVKVEPGTSRVTKKAVAAKKAAAATTPKKRNTKRRRQDSPSPEPMASDIEILPSREATEDPTPIPNGRHDIKLAPHPVGSRLVIHRSGAAYLAESVAPLPKIDVPTMDEIASGRWRPAVRYLSSAISCVLADCTSAKQRGVCHLHRAVGTMLGPQSSHIRGRSEAPFVLSLPHLQGILWHGCWCVLPRSAVPYSADPSQIWATSRRTCRPWRCCRTTSPSAMVST